MGTNKQLSELYTVLHRAVNMAEGQAEEVLWSLLTG